MDNARARTRRLATDIDLDDGRCVFARERDAYGVARDGERSRTQGGDSSRHGLASRERGELPEGD